MTALVTIEPAFAIHRMDPKFQYLSPDYHDSAAPTHLQEARVWIREPSSEQVLVQRWSRFTGQDVLLLLRDLDSVSLTDENRTRQHGAVRHSSHVVHRLQVSATSTMVDGERDYEITLGNEWSHLSSSLGSVIERHLQTDIPDSDVIFIRTEALGVPRPGEIARGEAGFTQFLQLVKLYPFLNPVLRITR